jgi:hypothetical protein
LRLSPVRAAVSQAFLPGIGKRNAIAGGISSIGEDMTEDEQTAIAGIRRTITAYTIAGDSRDAEAYHPLFAEDAVLEFAGFGPVPGFRCEGRSAIRTRTASWSAEPGKDPSLRLTGFIRHNLTTCEIVPTGPDTARARTYFLVFTEIGPDHMGTYDDDLVRSGADWLFRRRRIALDWRSPDSLFPPLR